MVGVESFIVRVMPSEGDTALCGVLRRVADGWETTFSDADELLVLLRTPNDQSTERETTS